MLDTDPERHDHTPLLTSGPPRMGMTKEVFKCPWFRVHEEAWDDFSDLDRQPFYRIESSDGVLVLALTKREEIILVRQFRHAIRRTTLEFPAGTVDRSESPEKAAARELLEETGYRSARLVELGSGHLMVNRFSSKGFFFLAQDCQLDNSVPLKESEEVVLLSPGQFKDLVLAGEFEQMSALSLLSLSEWTTGLRLLG